MTLDQLIERLQEVKRLNPTKVEIEIDLSWSTDDSTDKVMVEIKLDYRTEIQHRYEWEEGW